MKNTLCLLIFSLLFFFSCENRPKKKLVYAEDETAAETEANTETDTTVMLVGDLPVFFDSTHYLIFPVGKININKKDKSSYSAISRSESGDSGSSSIGYLRGDSYSGNLTSLYSQQVDSTALIPLIKGNLYIRSFQFLESVRRKTGKEMLLLSVVDTDTNKDKKLDYEDLSALYLASLDGEILKKLTVDFHLLKDWRIYAVNNRIYFNTMEDADRNGEFNHKDKAHYYFIDLDDNELNINEYNLF
ncbi:MAG: hypothetical protein CMO01_08040 [Thalassobius sp.]|nr:hypothetical protein [Thalassovita sp.]